MRTIKEIDKEITILKGSLENVQGTKTEVYSRIVGYYRSLRNWNKGKREEYNHRVTFNQLDSKSALKELNFEWQKVKNSPVSNLEAVASYAYFYRKTCPNCPPVKNYLSTLDISGAHVEVDDEEGFSEAAQFSVCSAPTVIFFDTEGREIFRAVNVQEIKEKLEPSHTVTPETV